MSRFTGELFELQVLWPLLFELCCCCLVYATLNMLLIEHPDVKLIVVICCCWLCWLSGRHMANDEVTMNWYSDDIGLCLCDDNYFVKLWRWLFCEVVTMIVVVVCDCCIHSICIFCEGLMGKLAKWSPILIGKISDVNASINWQLAKRAEALGTTCICTC